MPARKEMPSTIRRSSKKAQRTWGEAHDSAVETYGEGERSHRTAFSALKHTHEKVGDHWEAKDGKGPSDSRASKKRGQSGGTSHGGVDANASKKHLYEVAQKLEISGRSTMNKKQLVTAIERANNRKTTKARSRSGKS